LNSLALLTFSLPIKGSKGGRSNGILNGTPAEGIWRTIDVIAYVLLIIAALYGVLSLPWIGRRWEIHAHHLTENM